MGRLLYKIGIGLKTLFIYLFYLPGLILHEASHAIAALLTGSNIVAIKLFPSIEFEPNGKGYKVTYGYVESIARYRVSYMFIGLAPFFLWFIPIVVMIYNGWLSINPLNINIHEMLQFSNLWFFVLLMQIAWAGSPSSQDWRVFFYGLFSVSSIVIFLVGGLLFYFFAPIVQIFSNSYFN